MNTLNKIHLEKQQAQEKPLDFLKPVATFDEDRCKIILDEDFRQMVHGFHADTMNYKLKKKSRR